jgi:pimeloyl-ACP methyl ester carboxylesterase
MTHTSHDTRSNVATATTRPVDTTTAASSSSPGGPGPERGHIGRVVAGSIATGLVLTLASTLLLLPAATEPVITGAALLSWAVGWGLLWLLARRTTQPQEWARVPAALMGGAGAVHLLVRPDAWLISASGWLWPVVLAALVVWMVSRSRRSLRSRARPVRLYPLFAALALCAVGGAAERVAETRDPAHLAGAGSSYDVGDHRLFLHCAGTGSPTVVLESGLGSPAASMGGRIAPAVARTTRVCVYDRAGYGRSEPARTPRDGVQAAADLHALMAAAHETGPFVLAGHSSGAVYVRVYAKAYPDQVAGMVLLDGQSPDAMTEMPGWSTFYRTYRRVEALEPSVARLGVLRLFAHALPGDLPEPARTQALTTSATPVTYRALRDELSQLPTALEQAHSRPGSLGSKPLVVLTAGKDAAPGWMPLQEAMTTLSTNTVHRVLPDTTHASLPENPRDAEAAATAVTDVVTAARTGGPLSGRP